MLPRALEGSVDKSGRGESDARKIPFKCKKAKGFYRREREKAIIWDENYWGILQQRHRCQTRGVGGQPFDRGDNLLQVAHLANQLTRGSLHSVT